MAPQIVTRARAGLKPARSPYSPWIPGQPTGCTIHWEGAGGHSDHRYCAREWLSIQLYHLNTGYADIAYHWGVCQHGVIFEGRPLTAQSAAQRDGNKYRVAIVYMGGHLTPFTEAGKRAIAYLIANRASIPHADEPSCATSCAGTTINPWVRQGTWRNYAAPYQRPTPAPKPLPLPPQGVHHPLLRNGAFGPAVLELQLKLFWLASQRQITPDGIFGARTGLGVRNFQRFFGLHVDGVAGPKTWGLLDYLVAKTRKH